MPIWIGPRHIALRARKLDGGRAKLAADTGPFSKVHLFASSA